MKKIVDERQELELMKVERAGFWILFLALAADILIKVLFLGVPVRSLIGENIAFIAGCVTIIIGCTKRGLWTYYSAPCLKDYLVHSIGGTLIFSLLLMAALFLKGARHVLSLTAVFAVIIFTVMFAVMALMGEYTKKKRDRLEKEYEDE